MADVTISLEGAAAAARLRRASGELRDRMRGVEDEVAGAVEIIFAAHALVRSGRMARGITSRRQGDAVLVSVHAENPETGFDYVAVTRFGHRMRWIVPRKARALRFQPRKGGAFIFRTRVRGFRPSQDWVAGALPEIQAEADRAMASFGRGFVARLG